MHRKNGGNNVRHIKLDVKSQQKIKLQTIGNTFTKHSKASRHTKTNGSIKKDTV